MNRLADETSPYLRQHAGNPVDWFPWGDEAFEVARRRDRPVFLSIGYSACHWCHVMAHESFEDQPTARMLNDRFVSVKVDREERPDVDQVYMEAVQTITGAGGWPMSVFLTPDRRPFYGGTYFPPDDRRGFASFRTVLDALTDAWDHRRDEVEQQADELCRSMAARSMVPARPRTDSGLGPQPAAGEELALLDVAAADLAARFDPEWGGFGRAPKFPQPVLVDLALRHALRHRGDPDGDRSERMALLTLDAMAAGGIHDHLGGGFARYSTDDQWLVPHFEKMLYDQASLLPAYLHGWQVAKREDYLVVMNGIVEYVERDLTAPEGGVYSAEDADSDGGEGRFYVWSPEGVSRAVDEGRAGDQARAEAVAEFFEVREGGNWEGRSILRRPPGAPLVGDAEVEAGRRRLLAARALRPRPALDDKVLTEWNAMYASALAEAAAATGNRAWAAQAVHIGEFLLDRLRGDDGRWRRSWQREGGARHLAYAGDYAWLVDCFTRLGELTGEAAWTGHARVTADALVSLFLDEDDGGFFTTGHDAETLIVRTKDLFDGATPSANAVAARALARLGAITGEERYRARALGVVDMFGPLLSEHPAAFAQTALTADALGAGLIEVVVTGHRPDLVDVVRGRWLPGGVLAWGEPTASPLWQDREEGRAYVCRQYACRLPADDPAALSAQLDEALGTAGSA
ncbi:MAG TPA: thioredoxin domain-containing protein [Acidimicrobiales bacterium]|nr:thioredoxin domain-containing protein [Acidimicrobiales bacterium]